MESVVRDQFLGSVGRPAEYEVVKLDNREAGADNAVGVILEPPGIWYVGRETDSEFAFDGQMVKSLGVERNPRPMQFRLEYVAEDGLGEAELSLDGGAEASDFVADNSLRALDAELSDRELQSVGVANGQGDRSACEERAGAMAIVVRQLSGREFVNVHRTC
jgi:hypothetical protein